MMISCSSRQQVSKTVSFLMFAVFRMNNQTIYVYSLHGPCLFMHGLFGNPRWAKDSEAAMKASTFV